MERKKTAIVAMLMGVLFLSGCACSGDRPLLRRIGNRFRTMTGNDCCPDPCCDTGFGGGPLIGGAGFSGFTGSGPMIGHGAPVGSLSGAGIGSDCGCNNGSSFFGAPVSSTGFENFNSMGGSYFGGPIVTDPGMVNPVVSSGPAPIVQGPIVGNRLVPQPVGPTGPPPTTNPPTTVPPVGNGGGAAPVEAYTPKS